MLPRPQSCSDGCSGGDAAGVGRKAGGVGEIVGDKGSEAGGEGGGLRGSRLPHCSGSVRMASRQSRQAISSCSLTISAGNSSRLLQRSASRSGKHGGGEPSADGEIVGDDGGDAGIDGGGLGSTQPPLWNGAKVADKQEGLGGISLEAGPSHVGDSGGERLCFFSAGSPSLSEVVPRRSLNPPGYFCRNSR